MRCDPKRILVIYYSPEPLDKTRVTILHHLRFLENSTYRHDIEYLNVYPVYANFMGLQKRVESFPPRYSSREFDAVILHYSFLSIRTIGWLFRKLQKDFDWIADFYCPKIAIPQDEGDYAGILDEWLFKLGVSVIFSVHYLPERPLYPIMRNHATIYPCLPGYIDENTAESYKDKLLPIAKRPFDLVYRARRLPLWYGSAGLIKHTVAEVVAPKARAFGFHVDVSTQDRDTIPGDAWLDFIASSKAVLGAEGGYSVVDWRGEVKAMVKKTLKTNPELSFPQLNEMMPVGWDSYRLFTVTPRHFEAIITKTCQVLVEGQYKGVLIPDRHYIPLSSDWSNLEEVLEKLRDDRYIQEIVERAYEEILLSGCYSYRAFANELEKVMKNHRSLQEGAFQNNTESDAMDNATAALERQLIAFRQEVFVQEFERDNILNSELDKAISSVLSQLKQKLKRLVVMGFALIVLINMIFIVLLLL